MEDPERPLLTADDRHHLERVLRVRRGEIVVAADGTGRRCECEVRADGSGVALAPIAEVREEARAEPCISIAFAPLKGDRTELIVQKLTELGVDRILVLETDRSVVRWGSDRSSRVIDRMRRVSREAAAQSRRAWLPEVLAVAGVQNLPEVLRFADANPLLGQGVALCDVRGASPSTAYGTLVIGPEGGWSDAELELGLPMVRLSPQILRAETAAIAAGVVMTSLRAGTLAIAR